ncbi:MAG: NADH-quinone oxidoreductase subunit NuoN, partial [Thermocrispum sp.]
IAAAGVALGFHISDSPKDATTFRSQGAVGGALAVDGPTLFLWGTLLALGLCALLLIADRSVEPGGAFVSQAVLRGGGTGTASKVALGMQTEVFPLTLFALGGMMTFVASNDLLTMFVALEVLSLPLYLLCGLARRRRLLSQEAAMKYFLLGAYSSAFFVFGIALLYGYSGSMSLAGLDTAVASRTSGEALLFTGIGLVAVGLLFKIGAAPFHAWTPDVYQGAPTAVTGFMAACTKVAAFGALLRLFYVGLGGVTWDWQPMIWVVAILTMAIGSIVALTQTDIKRLLAYSSIAHAGFILVGFVGAQSAADTGDGITSLQAVLFYLVTYGYTTLGAFAVVTVVRDSAGEVTHLSRWAGLGKSSPVVAGVMSLFMLAFLGLPLTSGFTGKWAVFTAAWSGGAEALVIVGVLASVVTAFVYIRVIVLMFFSDPVGAGPTVVTPSILTVAAITVGAVATVVLGVLPDPVLDLARDAGEFIR